MLSFGGSFLAGFVGSSRVKCFGSTFCDVEVSREDVVGCGRMRTGSFGFCSC